jgi:hypothetical protein
MVLNHADDERSGRLTLPFMPVVDQLPSSVILKSQNEIEFILSANNILVMDLHTVGKNETPSTAEYERALRG